MTEVLRYYSAFPTQVTDESHSRLQQYVRAEDFDHLRTVLECARGDLRMSEQTRERMTAERDQLQRDLDARDQEIDRLLGHIRDARNELLQIKASIGFRGETLRVIGTLDFVLEGKA